MSRKIVLKSVLAVAMLGFVLVSASCTKEKPKEEDPTPKPKEKTEEIIGLWRYDTVCIKEVACDNPNIEAFVKIYVRDFGITAHLEEVFGEAYEFTTDGKAIHRTEKGSDKGSYTINGDKLTITDSEKTSSTFDLSFVDKTMYWTFDLFDMTELLTKHGWESSLVGLSGYGVTKVIFQTTFKK